MRERDTTLTPLSLVGCLGQFDLDPCAVTGHQTAKKCIVLPEDGLREEWVGRVWLNPPYSNPNPFLKKMAEHNNGIAIVLASTDTKWFQDHILNSADSILFLRGRPYFVKLDGTQVKLMRAVVLVAFGRKNRERLRLSGLEGRLVELNNP